MCEHVNVITLHNKGVRNMKLVIDHIDTKARINIQGLLWPDGFISVDKVYDLDTGIELELTDIDRQFYTHDLEEAHRSWDNDDLYFVDSDEGDL